MAYTRVADQSRDFAASPSLPKSRLGFLRRAFHAIVEGRQRAADREIEAFLRGRGKHLTDDTEREITRILSSSSHL
jgi:hypothetical protein